MDCSKKRTKEGKSLGTGETGVRGIPKADSLLIPPQENAVMATTSVFVVEPGEEIGKYHCKSCLPNIPLVRRRDWL